MNINKVRAVFKFLQNASIIRVHDCGKEYTAKAFFSPIHDDPENQVIYLSWTKNDQDYGTIFDEAGLEGAVILDCEITMQDIDGDPVTVSFYSVQPVRVQLQY